MLRVWGPWVCISSNTIICGMTYSKYLCQSLRCHLHFFSLVFLLFVLLLSSVWLTRNICANLSRCHLRFFHSSFYSSFSFSWEKKSDLPPLQQDRSWFKVARYSFSRPIPPKFEDNLRRHKQSFGKIATTVVLDKDENLLWSGLQWHRSCIATKWRYYLFYLQKYFSALGTVLPKSFTGAFSSNSRLDVSEV